MPYEVAATTWTNLLGCNEYKGADDARRDPRLRQADLGRYGGEPVEGFPFTGPTPENRTSTARPRRRRPVGGEEPARVAARPRAARRRRVADQLRSAPGLLAVGEAALELLEPVAAGDAAAEVERLAELGGELDQRGDDVLHRRVAQVRVGAAAEVVVEEAVAARRRSRRRRPSPSGAMASASQVRSDSRMRSK